MSQAKLSEMIGISYQQIQKYEKGMDSISVDRLVQIARALNLPLDLFFSGLPEVVAESGPEYGRLTDEEIGLLKEFKRIKNKRTKQAVIQIVKVLAGTRI
jgi:transcriptional regulator with XRE-family HTH domain